MISNRRFRPEPMTAGEAIAWFQSHKYVWYQAPMDHSPVRLNCVSVLKTWKSSPDKFAISARHYSQVGNESVRIDNGHLDRLRVPAVDPISGEQEFPR